MKFNSMVNNIMEAKGGVGGHVHGSKQRPGSIGTGPDMQNAAARRAGGSSGKAPSKAVGVKPGVYRLSPHKGGANTSKLLQVDEKGNMKIV